MGGWKQTRSFAHYFRSLAIANAYADDFSSPQADSKPRYRQKLGLVGLKLPYRLPADIWCDNPV